jgi:hypothetical protein
MAKHKKIEEVRKLIAPRPESKLTAQEIDFLQGRKGVNFEQLMNCIQPLLIFTKDSEATAAMVTGIAGKLNYPVIRFIRRVIDFPEGYIKPVRMTVGQPEEGKVIPASVPDESKAVDESNEAALIPEPVAVNEGPKESEEPGLKNGKYKLSFHGVFDDIDGDDEYDNNMRIRIPFGIG